MRISHRDLDACRRNPAAWTRRRLSSSTDDFIPMGYAGYTKLAIYAYHKTQDRTLARRKLSKYLNRFRSIDRIEEAEDVFDSYISWYDQERPIVVRTGARIILDIGHSNSLTGEVSRIDICRDYGYRGILLGSIPTDWDSQLRMPLIQLGLSQIYQRDPSEIEIGVQELDGFGISTRSYDQSQIDRAFEQVVEISKRVYEEEMQHVK
jgi:hypothetical protein